MKQFITVIFLFIASSMIAQLPPNDQHWQLVWEDDFNFINNTVWEVHNNQDRWSFNSDDLLKKQVVFTNQSSNVRIDAGNLILQVNHESYSCPSSALNFWGCSNQQQTGLGYNYTSGWVTSNVLFQYGYLEARIKVDCKVNLHPAFWTFSGSGITYNEIDIFEMIPGSHLGICNSCYHDNNMMTTNVHLQVPNQVNNGNFMVNSINDYTQYHKYAIEWSPSKIIWYVDGRVVRNTANIGIIYPQSIYFSIELDDILSSSIPNVWTFFTPSQMLIDYVRVYQKQTDCNNLINICNYDFSVYDNKVKNSITIGNGGCSNSIAVGNDVTIRASEFIQLMGDFTVPLGASFYADANKNCSNVLDLKCTHLFNRCNYNFVGYDNSIKKEIDLGGTGCTISISSANSNKLLKAVEKITLNKGVTIIPQNGNLVELSIVTCP